MERFYTNLVQLKKLISTKCGYLILFVSIMLFFNSNLLAQCPCSATDYGSINVAGWTAGQSANITTCQFGGERSTINNTVAGAVYLVSSCGASFDTQLSIYTTGCTYVAYNDDNGPACSGSAASVQFTSPGGNLYSVLNRYSCTTQSSCMTVTIQLVSLPCTPSSQGVYGTNSWLSYGYNGQDLNTYKGRISGVTQTWNNLNGQWGAGGAVCECGTTNVDLFSTRHLMNYTFSPGIYAIYYSTDDGVRISTDGGSSWNIVNAWDNTTHSGTAYIYLNGSTNIIADHRENGGGAGINVTITLVCNTGAPTYGSSVWNTYGYNGQDLNSFYGQITGVTNTWNNLNCQWSSGAPTTNCLGMPYDYFSTRSMMNYNFTAGYYDVTYSSDDGIRLSFDGGITWPVNSWDNTTHSGTYTVFLSGSSYLLADQRENTGGASINVSISGPILVVPSSSNNSYNVCSGNLYDAGGSSGDYGTSWNGYTVLTPTAGNLMRVSGTIAGETCCDYLYIYDGVGTGGTLLWSGVTSTGTVPPTTSISGPLTVKFTSDGSVVGAGFNLSLSCICAPPTAGTLAVSANTICNGSNVTYTATGGTNFAYLEYNWDGGGWSGSWQISNPYTWSSNNPGHTLNVRAVYSNACSTVYSNTVSTYVNALPAAPTSVTATPATICAGSSSNLNATSAGNTIFWWTASTGGTELGFSASGANYSVTPGATTTYYAEAQAAGGGSNVVDQADYTNNTLMANFSQGCVSQSFIPSQSNCSGAAVYMLGATTLTIQLCTGPGGSGVLAQGTVSASANAWATVTWSSVSVTPGATYYLTFTGSPDAGVAGDLNNGYANGMVYANSDCSSYPNYDYTFQTFYSTGGGGGCTSSTRTPVTVTVNTPPSAVTVSGAGTYCGSTTLTASGGTGGTIYWQNTTSGGTSTATASASQTVSASGTYYFRSRSAAGCWGTEGSATVTINAVPSVVTVSGGGTYCGSTTLTASGGTGGTIYWQGTTSGGTSTATASASQTVSASGTYYFRSQSAAGCWGTQGSAAVTIRPNFTPGAINTTGETICYNGNPALIGSTTAASGGDNSITYEWRANGTAIGSSNSATYDPPAGLTATTTYTRWAKDATCNTTFTQSTGLWVVTVQTPTAPTGLGAGDYLWSGEISNSWNTPANWIYYDGSAYSVATLLPSASSNVFIQSYSGTCATTNAVTVGSSTVYCQDLNIGSGLTLGASSTIEVNRNWNNSGTFVSSTGTVTFKGASNSSIGGSVATTFYQLNVNKSTASNTVIPSINVNTTSLRVNSGTYKDGGRITTITSADGNWDLINGVNANITVDGGGTIQTTNINHRVNVYGAGNLNVSNGTFHVEHCLMFDNGNLNISGSGIVEVDKEFYAMDWDGAPKGINMNMTGGTLRIGGDFLTGSHDIVASWNVTGGTIDWYDSSYGYTPNFSTNTSVNFWNVELHNNITANRDIIVKGNWINTGAFTASTGTVSFNGPQLQTINTGGSNFYKVTFNNTSAGNANIAVTTPMTINGLATFTDGIVYYSGTGSLTFGNSATAAVSSNNSFVNGAVIKTGSSAFIFPTGDVVSRDLGDGASDYVVLGAIGATPDAATTTSVEYNFSNTGMPDWWEHGGNMDATLHHVSDRENWIISAEENLSNFTLYWYDNAHANGDVCVHSLCDGNNIFVSSDLSVAYWSGSLWRDAGGTVTGVHNQGYITCAVVPFYGAKNQTFVTFGSKNDINPLPVELVEFNGQCNNGEVLLSWTTTSEINNDHFIIEKSENMKDFTFVSNVVGSGNSNTINYYDTTDKYASSNSYYRLTQVDFDGKTTSYRPINIKCSNELKTPELIVYPNPFNDIISIELLNFDQESAIMQISDQLGQIIYEENINTTTGTNVFTINLNHLKPSVYHIRIVSDRIILNKKIVKK